MSRAIATVMLCAALVVAALPAAAYPRPGDTELISWRADGSGGAGGSSEAAVSTDGRYVAFTSWSGAVLPDSSSAGTYHVYVRDRQTGATERVSVHNDGQVGNGSSRQPAISANGRYVAFRSEATNLVDLDTNDRRDIFVHDRVDGTTERVSVATDGTQADGGSDRPAISADGRYVAFASEARNLTPAGAGSGSRQVYVHDRETGSTALVSAAEDGTPGDGFSDSPAVSADGRAVAFYSSADNLVPGLPTTASYHVFVVDLDADERELVSVSRDGIRGDGNSQHPALSADGRRVAYESVASNLVPGDGNGERDVFVHDRDSGETRRVSVGSAGEESDGASQTPALNADGSVVVFESRATNLAADPANGSLDVFWHHVEHGVTQLVSVAAGGGQADGLSRIPAVSADGSAVAFHSAGRNLLDGVTTNATGEVYLRNVGPGLGFGALRAEPGTEGLDVSGWATFTGAVVSSLERAGSTPNLGHVPGVDLTAVQVIYRPEEEDLLVRWEVENLAPAGPLGTGTPGVTYVLQFQHPSGRYEVRATRDGVEHVFALWSCSGGCEYEADLSGGMGSTGDAVTAALPLDEIGGPALLRNVDGSVRFGGTPTRLWMPDARLEAPEVEVGTAPAGAPADEAVFELAALDAGWFSATVAVPNGHAVWARACLGATCETRLVSLP